MELTSDDLLKILKIIDESPYDDVRLECGQYKLHVQKAGIESPAAITGQPATAEDVSTSAFQPPNDNSLEERVTVRASMLGIFHRGASPQQKPCVEVGDKVAPGAALCSIDVLGLSNPITAGVGGMVVKILAEDATMVEYDQPLILIDHGLIDEWGDVLQ